jgi:hypothetical protein
VNGKISKKIRKVARRDFGEYAEAINKSPFRLRIKIALRVLRGKL